MKKIIKTLLLSTLISTASFTVLAKNVEQKVNFLQGSTHTTLTGKFQGYDDVRYRVYAKNGQILKFNINSLGNLAYVNIFAPGKKPGKDKALLIGSTVGTKGELNLSVDGDYIVQIYQMRNSARKNKTVKYSLDIEILNKVKK
ncbi:DNA breaking-rejoining protein [Acinetobacter oleivorans]|uniref:DNA breaking-rejoining protein n=1 Tax=Acinetobacter oleivorans TaxID=1148157 RepID=UPI001901A904|nr:DNA breaking-rejoining protein [Acinetobacter oleivorans]MBJ9739034.1 DNA breaking-rejoining protein [Acinetobacter oleivorans]MCU4410444.1 DNA breaking-rejoining protein [Acinetobacter oleivorans]